LRRVTEHLLAAGVHAIFVNGSMGAFNLLADAEQYRAIGIVVDQVAGRVPVMAGVSDTATRLVIEKAHRAEALGAVDGFCIQRSAPRVYHAVLTKRLGLPKIWQKKHNQ
jgi:dihydrodipicolinate synthase/N-acetylneuraminate lyase